MSPGRSVAVVGGGLAGISAGCALADAGYKVTLFERRPFLGGRASSYEHPGTGEVIDNCQHVLLGCCTNLIDLYRRLGVQDKIKWFTALTLIEPGGRRSRIAPSMLPAPLHVAPSFLHASALTLGDKFAIGRAMFSLMRALPEDTGENFLQWLLRHRQTGRAINRFWKVILVSAVNEDLDRISVRYGAQVFRESFLKSAEAGRMGIPRVPLSQLYSRGSDYIRARGGEVRLRASVDQVSLALPPVLETVAATWASSVETQADDASRAVARASDLSFGNRRAIHFDLNQVQVTSNGRTEDFDFCVLAVPYFAIAKLLPRDAVGQQLSANANALESSPITGIHLWFDRKITNLPHAVLLDRTIQWMFQKSALLDIPVKARFTSTDSPAEAGKAVPGSPLPPAAHGSYLELVVSSSKLLVNLKREEIIALALRELADFFPSVKGAKLLKAAVVKEIHATYSALPLSDLSRPPAKTAWANIFLAGDWTNTGWPATMEGAVRSGYNAAEALTHAAADQRTFRVPDLPSAGLMRLFG